MGRTKATASKQVPPGRQAPPGTWSPDSLREALSQGSIEEKLALLRKLGIVTNDGKLGARYQNWGKVVSRTPDE
jgi:hypothetical protein